MKRILLSAALTLCAFLPAAATSEPTTGSMASSGTQALTGQDEGLARGTVVVWNHYTTGKPTAHLRGTLSDEYGRKFAEVVARLEDHGGVTGYALTRWGYYSLRGCWRFDRCHERGWFELEFDYGDSREVELEGDFEGWRAYWNGEWELEYRD